MTLEHLQKMRQAPRYFSNRQNLVYVTVPSNVQGGSGKVVDGGLAHPKLFGDQAKREKR